MLKNGQTYFKNQDTAIFLIKVKIFSRLKTVNWNSVNKQNKRISGCLY